MVVVSSTRLETDFGTFRICFHASGADQCITFSNGNLFLPGALVRLHSGCLFSEVFNATDCDCKLQAAAALKRIGEAGGVFVYLFQEGRGVGLANKIRALEVERIKNLDTAEAFHHLGFELDARDYSLAAKALKDLGVNPSIRLMTNNPRKIKQLQKKGFLVKRVSLKYPLTDRTRKHLLVLKNKLGHEIDFL